VKGQLSLLNHQVPSFEEGIKAQAAVDLVHEAAFKLVDSMQAKVAAIVIGVDEGTLSKKRTRKDRNRLALDEAARLLVIANRDEAKRFLTELLLLINCKPAEDAPPDEGYAARLEAALEDELSPKARARVLQKARRW